jgi:uncharacterized CHY-type Zn-finger protein
MNNISCPVCSKSVTTNPLKSWKYQKFDVNRFECPNCKLKFNSYKSAHNMFTIPGTK